MITVYGVTMSRTLRVLWMLEELGLDYERVKTQFATGDIQIEGAGEETGSGEFDFFRGRLLCDIRFRVG